MSCSQRNRSLALPCARASSTQRAASSSRIRELSPTHENIRWRAPRAGAPQGEAGACEATQVAQNSAHGLSDRSLGGRCTRRPRARIGPHRDELTWRHDDRQHECCSRVRGTARPEGRGGAGCADRRGQGRSSSPDRAGAGAAQILA